MPFNLPGSLVPFYALFYPRLVVPHLSVADVRQLDFAALRRAGYKGAVFDKDNCLTLPLKDAVVPEIEDAWKECLETFGPSNVLIVSNSAGTAGDPGNFQAESVMHHLNAPVLLHRSLKPSYGTAGAVITYFASLASPLAPHELVVIGDRIFTDVVLAKRLGQPTSVFARIAQRLHLSSTNSTNPQLRSNDTVGPLSIWTTGVWKKESMLVRWSEHKLVEIVERFVPELVERRKTLEGRFIKAIPPPVLAKESPVRKASWAGRMRDSVVGRFGFGR